MNFSNTHTTSFSNKLRIAFLKQKLFFSCFFLLALFSCRKDEHFNTAATPISEQVTQTQKKDIDPASIDPAALEYYKNIATMADWYALHPSSKKNARAQNGDTSNTLYNKLAEISILDSNNKSHSLFEINANDRKEFLETWVLIESDALSHKLKLDSSRNSSGLITERNEAFREAFGSNKKALDDETEDPYWKMRQVLDAREADKQPALLPPLRAEGSVSEDDLFWAKVAANNLVPYCPIKVIPISLTPQTFVDRIRPSLQAGRLLIALPGGSETYYPIVFYPNRLWYDVGHVAVISENNLPHLIHDQTSFTIGTSKELGMHREQVYNSWCKKHGLAYVGQVYDIKWITKYTITHILWTSMTIKTPYYVREARDVNNLGIYSQVISLIQKSYCYWYEIMTAKAAAPSRFICSTSAWWCVTKSANVNIGDFYKPTIFPAGVFLSDRVRIIDNTLN
jgi:hypothetical protein